MRIRRRRSVARRSSSPVQLLLTTASARRAHDVSTCNFVSFSLNQAKYFTVPSLEDLFKGVDNHTVIDFIKEIHFTTNCNLC